MTIDIIKTRGSHYEVGLQQARIYRCLVGNINMVKVLREMEMVQAGTPIGGPPFNFIFSQMLHYGAKKIVSNIYDLLPSQYEKLEGMAEGFNLSVERLAQVLFFENLSGNMKIETTVPRFPSRGCSAGIITKGNQGFLIKNYDFPNELEEWQMLRYIDLNQGYSTVCLGEGAAPGVVSGMNDKGLAMTINAAYTNDIDMDLAPSSMIVQECLEKFSSAEKTAEFLMDFPIALGQIFVILDRDQKGMIVERTNNEKNIREMNELENGSYIGAANSFFCENTREVQLPEETIWTPKDIHGLKLIKGSDIRHQRISELLKDLVEKTGNIDIGDLRAILSDHGDLGEGGDTTICRHAEYWKTLSSVYMEPKNNRIFVNEGNPCSGSELKEYELEFDYKIPNIRFQRRNNPHFPFFNPVTG